jgi:hypothetical protein
MATQALARPQFGSMDHLRRPASVLDRVAERQDRFLRLKARARQGIERVAAQTKATAKDVGIRTAEVAGTAFAFGAMQGGMQEKLMIGPVPLDLLAGVAAHAAGFMVDPGLSPHLHAVGDGALAAFATTWGRAIGKRARKAMGLPPGVAGEVPPEGGGALSNEELARLARRG